VQELPGTIPPGAEYELKIEYHTGAEGEFVTEVPIYTDCPGLTEFILTIKGNVARDSGASL
jgi:hypothetical protein